MVAAGLAAAPGGARTTTPTPQQVRRACGSLNLLGGTARAVRGAVPAPVLALYAVFRRTQVPSDMPPAQPQGLPSLAQTVSELQTYDPADTRLVATVGKTSVYLLAGTARDLTLPAKCRRVLPADELSFLDSIARQIGHGPAYCLLTVDSSAAVGIGPGPAPVGYDYTGGQCYAFAVSSVFAADTTLDNGRIDSAGLVPDGVGAVLTNTPALGAPETALVQNNVAVGPTHPASAKLTHKLNRELRAALHSPRRLRRFFDRVLPSSISWLATPGGAVVRTFPRPRGFLDETVAEFLASEELLTQGTSTTCSSSGAPGKPTKQHCTTSRHG